MKKKTPKRAFLRDLELPTAAGHATAAKLMKPYLASFQRAANDQTAADFGASAVIDSVDGAKRLRAGVKRAVVKKARQEKQGKTRRKKGTNG
jgi:hypothetical protein